MNKINAIAIFLFATMAVSAQTTQTTQQFTGSTNLEGQVSRNGEILLKPATGSTNTNWFSLTNTGFYLKNCGSCPYIGEYIKLLPKEITFGVGASSQSNPYTTIGNGYFSFSAPPYAFSLSTGQLTFNGDFSLTAATNTLKVGGKVVIGSSTLTTPGAYKLFVEGGILTESVKVALKSSADWADFVFEPAYKLPSLYDVEKFIIANKHLPNVPSATDMVSNGLDVVKTDAMLLQKIEELTLYIIQQQKEIDALKAVMQPKN